MHKIGEGMVSEAFHEEGRVLLVGKRPDAFKIYSELKINLDFLDGKIKSLRVPNKAELIQPCEKYPLGAIIFDYVPGTSLSERINNCTIEQRKAIGKKLVEFIAEMQAIKPDPSMHNKTNEIERNCTKFGNALKLLKPYLSDSENKKIRKVAGNYLRFLSSSIFCMTHGDLHFENMIVDESNILVGIIDFGNVEYYVPETEFMWMQNPDPNFANDQIIFDAMIKNYNGRLKSNNIKLVRLVGAVRFFRVVENVYQNMRDMQIDFIRKLLAEYNI